MNCTLRPGEMSRSPRAVASCCVTLATRLVMYGQNDVSLLRRMARATAMPHSCSADAGNRRLLNGIAMRATNPNGVSRPSECHTVS